MCKNGHVVVQIYIKCYIKRLNLLLAIPKNVYVITFPPPLSLDWHCVKSKYIPDDRLLRGAL